MNVNEIHKMIQDLVAQRKVCSYNLWKKLEKELLEAFNVGEADKDALKEIVRKIHEEGFNNGLREMGKSMLAKQRAKDK